MDFLKILWTVVTSESVMEPLIVILIGYGLQVYKKNRKYRIIADTTIDIVDYIEEHYKEWGIEGNEKMEKFVELFVQEYKKATGRAPKEGEIRSAKLRAEAYVQRARRGGAPQLRIRRIT
ncbi:MAG: hypothetical protein GX969_00115 [Firmicutes bacterium]|nr:hypothetical protein [Bacillota bacterium]